MYSGTIIEAKIHRLQNQIQAKEENLIDLIRQRDSLVQKVLRLEDENHSLRARIGAQDTAINILRNSIVMQHTTEGGISGKPISFVSDD